MKNPSGDIIGLLIEQLIKFQVVKTKKDKIKARRVLINSLKKEKEVFDSILKKDHPTYFTLDNSIFNGSDIEIEFHFCNYVNIFELSIVTCRKLSFVQVRSLKIKKGSFAEPQIYLI